MLRFITKTILLSLVSGIAFLSPATADDTNLQFESGNFDGWTTLVSEPVSDELPVFPWLVLDDVYEQNIALWLNAELDESELLVERRGPAWGILFREFTNVESMTLAFLYENGYLGGFTTDNRGAFALNTDSDSNLFENQWIRFDILKIGSSPTTLNNADIAHSILTTLGDEPSGIDFISTYLEEELPTQGFILRVAVVGNLGLLGFGFGGVELTKKQTADSLFAQDSTYNSQIAACSRDFVRDIQALSSPTLNRYQSCLFYDVTKSNIAGVNADLAAAYKASVTEGKTMTPAQIIGSVQSLAIRYNTIDRLINNPQSVYATDLVNIGLTGIDNSARKFTLMRELRALPKDQIDTYAELEAAIKTLTAPATK